MRFYDLIETPLTCKTFLSQNEGNTRIKSDDESVSIYFESVDLSTKERYFDANGYPKVRDKAVTLPTQALLAQARQSEMVIELNWCDLQLKLHASADTRAVATLNDIHAHARACRDHVRDIDKDGILEIVGDKPVRPE